MKNLFFISLFLTLLNQMVLAQENFELNDRIFINACGNSEPRYSSTPLNFDNIFVEVPNTVIGQVNFTERSFKTSAKSIATTTNGRKFTAKLDDLIALQISNDTNKILVSRNVSGHTSLFELKSSGRVIGWGVGWHKYCGEYYEADFTVIRLYVPQKDGSIKEQVLSANPSWFSKVLAGNADYIFTASGTIYGPGGYADRHYSALKFYLIDDVVGVSEIKSSEQLKNLAPDLYRSLQVSYPLKFLHWLSYIPHRDSKYDAQLKEYRSIYDPKQLQFEMNVYKKFLFENVEKIIQASFEKYGEEGFSRMNSNYDPKFQELDAENTKQTLARFQKQCKVEDAEFPETIAYRCLPKFALAILY